MSKITRFFAILLFISALCLCGCVRKNPFPRAEKGVIDLTQWVFKTDGRVHIDGEWEFYWERLLSPEDFKTPVLPDRTGFFDVPGYWNGYAVKGKPLKGDGFATFRLNARINPGQDRPGQGRMAVRIDSQATSYRLWVNGRLISENGVIGTDRDSAVPQYLVRISDIDPAGQNLEFVLQVSNFSLYKGGPNDPSPWGSNIRSENTRRFCGPST